MMSTILQGKSMNLIVPYGGNYNLTTELLKFYDNFNKRDFDKFLHISRKFEPFISVIYDVFKQNYECEYKNSIFEIIKNNVIENSILLGFSGGLDSAYYALLLKEKGLNVHLVHFANLNSYENNNALKSSVDFANKNNLPLTIVQVKKNNKNKMYWVENPIKNQLIQAFLIDYGINKGIYNIALGDDYSMSFERKDFILGTNTTDCREVQLPFEKTVKTIYPQISFSMIERPIGSDKANKFERLEKLIEYDSIDCYYSCVGAGRFNQYNRKRDMQKYNISLPQYNCGSYCAKCALHNLLMYYSGLVEYPVDFINKCWERLWNTEHGSIKAMFGEHIDIKEKIKNLYIY